MNLTADMIIQTKTGTPPHLAMYARDVQGPIAVANAVKDVVMNGKKVKMVMCTKDGAEVPKVYQFVTISTVPKHLCVRACGENGNPVGAGSHTLYGSMDDKGDPKTMDMVEIAATLMEVLTVRGCQVWRMKD